jgi:hypothetical protein
MPREQAKGYEAVQRINVTEACDVRQWADRFRCTPDELRKAVSVVCNIASDVSDHLSDRKPASDPRAALEAAFGTPSSASR